MQFKAPRGTTDILPEERPYWRLLESTAERIAENFGYLRIDTPIFEDTGLFVKGVGDSTDIVEKETYTFKDRGGDSLTLRPEGTAPVCRSYLENGMNNLPQPVRLYYLVPNFRYERPQSGRYRAFHQFGVEVFGEVKPYVDAEVIEISWQFLSELGLNDLSLTLNSIGDKECRPGYIDKLNEYYHFREEDICEDCSRRLANNPLRLLDCKVEKCQPIIEGAPSSIEHLCPDCESHWEDLKSHISDIGIPFEIDNRLVRGLDYYSRTVYEIAPPIEGRTSVITGGGRYDGLIEQLGGPMTPGIGFGMGLERVIENLKRNEIKAEQNERDIVMVAHIGDDALRKATTLASQIRRHGGAAMVGPSRGLRSQLRYATSVGASHAVIIGDDEISTGAYKLRNLRKSDQSEATAEEILAFFSSSKD